MKKKERSTEHSPTNENRTVERCRLVFYLRLFDQESKDIIGHLTDISTAGLMLVSVRPIEKNTIYAVRLILPKEVAGRTELLLKIRCIWCRPDPIPNFHIAGFNFVEIDLEQKKLIDALTEEFSREESLAQDNSERPACSLTHTTGR
ncbi:MAG: PilZ domain-containing protein [Desulfofustis sp.]|nr:PilZ domain-containing protein [Desulfofustis sp.]